MTKQQSQADWDRVRAELIALGGFRPDEHTGIVDSARVKRKLIYLGVALGVKRGPDWLEQLAVLLASRAFPAPAKRGRPRVWTSAVRGALIADFKVEKEQRDGSTKIEVFFEMQGAEPWNRFGTGNTTQRGNNLEQQYRIGSHDPVAKRIAKNLLKAYEGNLPALKSAVIQLARAENIRPD
jgi:hypothetical protein